MFSHPVYLFLREFSLQDFRGGSNRVVDAVLLTCPGISASRAGVFIMKTKLYGSKAWIKKAYRVALQEVNSE
ncbi:hypothetical protein E3174_03115 [Escherichia coli O157:H7]|uniref:hypothetical protein n=1 Tax=Escherichia coli TaxID=562 RepID=UPI0006ACB743|nr:hypothetical protein [Escherichia coli]NOV09501.1 hypothetical protein [Escherichia coli O157:H7]QKB09527.1 hypothetical protein E3160_14590 [Escherichia coli O157:H7]